MVSAPRPAHARPPHRLGPERLPRGLPGGTRERRELTAVKRFRCASTISTALVHRYGSLGPARSRTARSARRPRPYRPVTYSGEGSFGRIVGVDRKSTRLNSSHSQISYAVFCLKKKKKQTTFNIYDKNNHTTDTQSRNP